jgi:hypothetical protein
MMERETAEKEKAMGVAEKSGDRAAQKVAPKAVGSAALANGWPVDDITGLARRLPEVNPANYFDGQAKESFEQSLVRWPVLARLMKLVPADRADEPLERESARKQGVD